MNPQIKFSGGINPALLFITCAPKALNNIPPLSHWCYQHIFVPMKKLFVRIFSKILPIFFNWVTAFKKGGWADTCLLILPFILDSQIKLSFVPLPISFTPFVPQLYFVFIFVLPWVISPVEQKIWLRWPGLDLPNCLHHHLPPKDNFSSIYLYLLYFCK